MALRTKYKKETDKNLAHTDVYDGEKLLGYFMKNNSMAAGFNENWNFFNSSRHPKLSSFHTPTKQGLLERLNVEYYK